MKKQTNSQLFKSHASQKEGFILFLALAVASVLTLAALTALASTKLEARTANNNYHTTRALYHAEAGVKLVKLEVERRLRNGESLSTILENLSVEAPNGLEFETIDHFQAIVPERLFSFESIGTSAAARVSVVVQYRRHPVVSIGLFGNIYFGAQNHTSVYGFDSRIVTDPSPLDNNGGASIGSNGGIVLGNNNFTFDGSILLGETGDGLIASCTRCDSSDYTKAQIGAVDPDPMGLTTGGSLAQTFDAVMTNNDNGSNGDIVNNSIQVPNGGTLTLKPGDYYLTSIYMAPESSMVIDNDEGPVRIFLDGPFRMQPNGNTILNKDGAALNFQIFSKSTEEIRIQPSGNLQAFIYAPLAEVQIQPSGNFMGNVWAESIQIQPGGDIYIDTSIGDEMITNNLEIHAWYERQGQ